METVTKSKYIALVEKSFSNAQCKEHKIIQDIARKYFCFNSPNVEPSRKLQWKIDFIIQVQRDFLKDGHGLSSADPIALGFDDLVVETTGLDFNTTLIYLYGFSDCMTIFETYRLYAQPRTIALDLGSNLGIHSMVLSRCVGNEGKVFGFEAMGSIYERSLYNIQANKIKNIEIRNIGVGEKEEKVCFDDKSDDCNIGKGSVSEDGDIKIQLTTVDQECADCELPISLIKLDLEGYEVKALLGAQEVLAKHQPVIICEYNKAEYSYAELLSVIPYECNAYVIPYTFNVKLEQFDESTYKQGDIIFVPKNKRQPPEYLKFNNKGEKNGS